MGNKKALIVIDMQNDYLWENRKPMFGYDTQSLVSAVNTAVKSASDNGTDVIYIRHILPDLPTNRLIIGFSIKGTRGAEIYSGVDILSDKVFDKCFSNAYTAKPFREHMQKQGYTEVSVCGLDLCGCVGKTALGAVKTGAAVTLLGDCTASRFSTDRINRMKQLLTSKGVVIA